MVAVQFEDIIGPCVVTAASSFQMGMSFKIKY